MKNFIDHNGTSWTKNEIIEKFQDEFYMKFRVRPPKKNIIIKTGENCLKYSHFEILIRDSEQRGLNPKRYNIKYTTYFEIL